jgi:hypothetical protein
VVDKVAVVDQVLTRQLQLRVLPGHLVLLNLPALGLVLAALQAALVKLMITLQIHGMQQPARAGKEIQQLQLNTEEVIKISLLAQ